ncbi:hypothetical protein VitviT2T_010366 [Vitis vinifera]|uniref:C3H1-type domain-containing protein n=1 Tax=Vitis vinifera TaxID=29760 RepID=A0ABY9C7H5_VITVI|nr:hypothetical protein VitviT2T_010366 [Vitis vinifera]
MRTPSRPATVDCSLAATTPFTPFPSLCNTFWSCTPSRGTACRLYHPQQAGGSLLPPSMAPRMHDSYACR